MLDYRLIIDKGSGYSSEAVIAFLMEELPYLWRSAYEEMIPRADVCNRTDS